MATILDFRATIARPVLRDECEAPGAQIIIFPGVRRERHAEPQKPRARREKGRPKRDRLEIPD